jgi:hypothetical protein
MIVFLNCDAVNLFGWTACRLASLSAGQLFGSREVTLTVYTAYDKINSSSDPGYEVIIIVIFFILKPGLPQPDSKPRKGVKRGRYLRMKRRDELCLLN